MDRNGPRLIVLIFCVILCSCVKPVQINTRNEEPILVVEGSITTDSVPYSVKLSYSGPYKFALDIPEQYQEKEAAVTMEDDKGGKTNLVHVGSGLYETTDRNYVGKTGNSYWITIELKNGKKYVSKPELMKPAVSISNIAVKFVNDQNTNYPASLHSYITVQDPADQENYYKWDFYSWGLRQTHGISCGFGCVLYEYCYQKFVNEQVHILSDASINGNQIKDLDVGKSYIYTYGLHYIDISQWSLTREAYQFWKQYEEQVTRNGSILDPLPAAIRGNVYNAADPADFALGYFSAASVVHKRVTLVPFGITDFLLKTTAAQFIPDGPKICFETFPNTLSYPPPPANQYPPPAGWENAERIEVRW